MIILYFACKGRLCLQFLGVDAEGDDQSAKVGLTINHAISSVRSQPFDALSQTAFEAASGLVSWLLQAGGIEIMDHWDHMQLCPA